MPMARGRRLLLPRASGVDSRCSKSDSGRLSTTSQPISSSVRSAVDLPAPDRPVTSKMRSGAALRFIVTTGSGLQAETFEREFDLDWCRYLLAADRYRGKRHACDDD